MKKLLSMLLVVAMIASMSLVAFAAETNTVSTEIVETDDGITVTVYVTNPVNVSGFVASLAFPSASVSTDKSYTLASDFAACSVTPSSKTGNVKFLATFGTATEKYVTKSGKVAMISFPLTRIDDSADLTSVFAYGSSLYVAKINEGTAEYTSAKNADHFVAPVYVDDRKPSTPAVDAEAATEAAIKDLAGDWTSGEFTYPGATPDTTVGKKVATFGKANVILTAENYGVKIGGRFYPGKMDVPAGSYFAIIVVNSDSDAAIKDAYTYSIYTGNANNNPTIIAENLSAVVK